MCYILPQYCGTFHYANCTTTLTVPSINTATACSILSDLPTPPSLCHLTITKPPPQDLLFISDITTLSFLQTYITTPPPTAPIHFFRMKPPTSFHHYISTITLLLHLYHHQFTIKSNTIFNITSSLNFQQITTTPSLHQNFFYNLFNITAPPTPPVHCSSINTNTPSLHCQQNSTNTTTTTAQ